MQLLTPLWLLIALASAQYELRSNFSGLTFFDNFLFYTSWDPTFGYVHYVDQAFAQANGMINITDTSAAWGVETTQTLNPSANLGRLSIRLVTLQSWTHGLFILDLAHMPSNVCGVWPAIWMLGSGVWPAGGEIDIVEYVNNGVNDLMALHTSESCTVAGADQLGTLVTSDCAAGAGYTGCTVSATQANNSGDTFNDNGGGVYAWEWTSTAIRIWFFPRNAIPASITTGVPDVDEFGTPAANFEGDCDIDAHFYNASLLFDVDFCGSYAGNVWEANGCPMLDPENGWSSCNEYVALNPSAFEETFWEVNYLHVYQVLSGTMPTSTSALSSVTPAISTSTAVSTALSGAEGRTTSFTMSLAGTTPTITTGSFSETSSLLSVLSSLSSASEASASSMSSSLVARSISASSFSSTSSTALPFTSVTTPSSETTTSLAQSTTPSTTPSTTALPVPTATPTPPGVTSTPPTPAPCTGIVCTSNVFVTVVATITVGSIAAREPPAPTLGQRDRGAANDWDKFDLCSFEVYSADRFEVRSTGFTCTLTREEILNGELITETAVASTSVQSWMALTFDNFLTVDKIAIDARETEYLTPVGDFAFTGSFTPSGTSFISTTLTAYPKMPTPDERGVITRTLPSKDLVNPTPAFRIIDREEHLDSPETVTKVSTNYVTVSKVAYSPTSTSPPKPTGSTSAGASMVLPRVLSGMSFLVALAAMI